MHNYTVPAVLKAWIDQVLRAGRTFAVTPSGKVPLLSNRPVYVVVSSGGYVNGERARQPDFLTLYLKAVFATIGINNVNFIALEAASRSAELRQQAFAQARKQMADLL